MTDAYVPKAGDTITADVKFDGHTYSVTGEVYVSSWDKDELVFADYILNHPTASALITNIKLIDRPVVWDKPIKFEQLTPAHVGRTIKFGMNGNTPNDRETIFRGYKVDSTGHMYISFDNEFNAEWTGVSRSDDFYFKQADD